MSIITKIKEILKESKFTVLVVIIALLSLSFISFDEEEKSYVTKSGPTPMQTTSESTTIEITTGKATTTTTNTIVTSLVTTTSDTSVDESTTTTEVIETEVVEYTETEQEAKLVYCLNEYVEETSVVTTYEETQTTTECTDTYVEQVVYDDIIGDDGVININGYDYSFSSTDLESLYKYCDEYELEPLLMMALFCVESGVAVDNNLSQITSICYKQFCLDNGYIYPSYSYITTNTDANIHVAAYSLRLAIDYFNGNIYDGLAGYNKGIYGHSHGYSSLYADKVLQYKDTIK